MREFQIAVNAGAHDRVNCPLSVALPEGVDATTGTLHDPSGAEVPCQICEGAVFFMLTCQAARTQAVYRLALGGDEPAPAVTVEERTGAKVDVKIGGELFTTYNHGADLVRPYLYPFVAAGKQITRNWPIVTGVEGESKDHEHHKSVYTAHGLVNGTDNWSEGPNHGFTRHRAFALLESGPVNGRIVADNDWLTKDRQKILEQQTDLTFYNYPGGERLLDYLVTFHATEGAVLFGDTKEGGILAVRVATSMDGNKGGLIENSYGGLTERETWGKRAEWCDYSGRVEGAHLGIAIMDHPTSFRHPTYWHVRDYGLFTANPFGLSDFYGDKSHNGDHTLPADQTLRFRYRLFVHRGDAPAADVRGRYLDFIFPPIAEIG